MIGISKSNPDRRVLIVNINAPSHSKLYKLPPYFVIYKLGKETFCCPSEEFYQEFKLINKNELDGEVLGEDFVLVKKKKRGDGIVTGKQNEIGRAHV